ncbi:hypothetical protein BGZ94_003873 [Podila epigama]|nr:hypothetical protein BGZ94_003873 [Podila epigama]
MGFLTSEFARNSSRASKAKTQDSATDCRPRSRPRPKTQKKIVGFDQEQSNRLNNRLPAWSKAKDVDSCSEIAKLNAYTFDFFCSIVGFE